MPSSSAAVPRDSEVVFHRACGVILSYNFYGKWRCMCKFIHESNICPKSMAYMFPIVKHLATHGQLKISSYVVPSNNTLAGGGDARGVYRISVALGDRGGAISSS